MVLEDAEPTSCLLYFPVALQDVAYEHVVARSWVYGLTLSSDLAPIAFVTVALLGHFSCFVFKGLIDILIPLLIVLRLGQLQLCLCEVLLAVFSPFSFYDLLIGVRDFLLLLRRLFVFRLVQSVVIAVHGRNI